MESSKDFDKHVIIIIGLSGSGKTTYSDQLMSENSESVAVIERDRIRHEMQRERDVEGYDERWVCGERVNSLNEKEYQELLKYYRAKNKRLGYGDDEKNWEQEQYERERRSASNIHRA